MSLKLSPSDYEIYIPIAEWIEKNIKEWLFTQRPLFKKLSAPIDTVLNSLDSFLNFIPFPIILLIFIFFVILFFNKPQNEWFYNAYLLIYPTWIDLISNITNFLKLNVGDLLYLISLPIIFKHLYNSKTRRNFLYRAGFTGIFIYSFFCKPFRTCI